MRTTICSTIVSDATFVASNPGPVGQDTGYEFTTPDGRRVRVIRKKDESRADAIARVRKAHGL